MENGMKSFPIMLSTYDHVLSGAVIVIACVVVDDAHCTISQQFGLKMTTSLTFENDFW
jgi:hypothetical protein